MSIMNYIERSFRAVCRAIDYFSQTSENIFLPIKPTYAYDLAILSDISGIDLLMKVKVIETESKAPSGNYVVNLRKSGGYANSKEVKADFDPSMCDILFVISPDGAYLIPSSVVTQKRAISLSMFSEFKIKSDPS